MVFRCSILLTLFAAVSIGRGEGPREGVEFFERKIRPLFVKHCYECHGPEAKKLGGDLRLDRRDAMLKGGATGPAIVRGDPTKSLLIQAVRHQDDLKMPPKSKLPAEEIADLEAWVKMGAPTPEPSAKTAATFSELWSLRPLSNPAIPNVRDVEWAQTAIDRFVLAKLEENGQKPGALADKRTLIRRATFDLTGLPPAPDEIDAFLLDNSVNAFASVVDRLLASPTYGERWGRHWLDVVRYADTAGDNSDYPVPQMYRYRNWVIDAINRDLPYDEFVRQQLAGDLLPSRDEADRHAKLIATGYLANARRFGSYEDERYPWHLTIEDTIDNLGRTFLGLTINCCRCHDHKFDPFTQKDYYALYGFFQSTRYPRPGIELDQVQRDFVPLAAADRVERFDKERREKLAEFDAKLKQPEADKKVAEASSRGAAGLFRVARQTIARKRVAALDDEIKSIKKNREANEKRPLPFETVYAVAERPTAGKRKIGNACVQIKGDPERLGPEVPRRFPTALGGSSLTAEAKGSGRLELANWIVDPKNSLTARVMVNRIWQYHFGQGIVPTPSDFGKQGQPPSDPELLDYLANRFIESGWSLKAMHRLVMLSVTYQQAAGVFPRRRLSAEEIRDAMMSVSGTLDRSPGGPHPFPEMKDWKFTQHAPFKAVYETNRRSVYLMTQRIQRHPFLMLFDGADTNASTATRITSTTPLQALYLMNDPFVHTQARKFAERLRNERGDDRARIERAYELLFGRLPTREEADAAIEYLARVGEKLRSDDGTKAWESLARGLLMSNEFVYAD